MCPGTAERHLERLGRLAYREVVVEHQSEYLPLPQRESCERAEELSALRSELEILGRSSYGGERPADPAPKQLGPQPRTPPPLRGAPPHDPKIQVLKLDRPAKLARPSSTSR